MSKETMFGLPIKKYKSEEHARKHGISESSLRHVLKEKYKGPKQEALEKAKGEKKEHKGLSKEQMKHLKNKDLGGFMRTYMK